MGTIRMSDAEREVMEIVWNSGGEVSTAEIIEQLKEKNSWKHTTILTLAKRLVDKKILEVRKEKRMNYYRPLVSKQEYKSHQADDFVNTMYSGSIKSLVASLYDNGKIDEEDLKELNEWIGGL
ncbi:MAG: BlaI/MecI/CopY family transcriptional regulator [Filifactor alocis]|nr:BlaI/MecI/CopY family transcriptional regulator [Filifactor alocis]